MSDTATSLGHMPGDTWEFDESVTRVFDDMLARSIPQYEVMRDACFRVGRRFVQRDTAIVDLGASRGEALAPFVREFGAYNTYVGVEVSEPMFTAMEQRFDNLIRTGLVTLYQNDLRTFYPPARASLTLCVLTLMFIPINYRQRILGRIYERTVSGGAVILVEKVIGQTYLTDELFVEEYHALKAANGYTHDEIERKRLALEGVQVPVTASWNVDSLEGAGFRHVECFWRWMNFAAWVGVKG